MAEKIRKELFISYGREPEVIQFVMRLKTDLENGGFTVWLDTQDIPAGSDWHGAIGTGLSSCRAIVPIITKKYIGSRYCTNELYTADGDKKSVFPIVFEDVSLEESEAGRGVKFVISGVNWTMCRPGVDDYNHAISRLMQGMKDRGLGGVDSGEQEASPAATSHQVATPKPKPKPIGPVSTLPLMVIPDVENPEGITSSSDGSLIVSSMTHRVLFFDSNLEKTMELGGDPGIGVGQFLSPTGVAIDKDGNILVASHYFLQKFSTTGKFLQQAGGTDPKGFIIESPRGLAIGKEGQVYISEQQKHRVKVLNPDLSLRTTFTDACRTLGSGHLNMPQGIAVNSEGLVYVADMMNHAVQVFDAEGQFLFKFGKMGAGIDCITSPSAIVIDKADYVYLGSGTCKVSIFDSKGTFMQSFGEYGSDLGKFNQIRAMHIDRNGLLYVGEWTSNRIQIFKLAGYGGDSEEQGLASEPLTQAAGSQLPVPVAHPPAHMQGKSTSFTTSKGVVLFGPNVTFGSKSAVSIGSNVIIGGVVQGPGEVQKLPSAGAASTTATSQGGVSQQPTVKFAKSASAPCKKAGAKLPVKVLSHIKKPSNIASGRKGEVVIAFSADPSIVIFSADYEKVAEIARKTVSYACIVVDSDNNLVTFSSSGIKKFDMTGRELLDIPSSKLNKESIRNVSGVAIGSQGQFYVASFVDKCVHILETDFSYRKSFADKTKAFDVAVNTNGDVYVPDQKRNTIKVFTGDGDLLFQFGDPGRMPLPHMAILVPMALCIDHHDNVYVGSGMNFVAVFDKEGSFIEKIGSSGKDPGQFSSMPRPLCIDLPRRLLYAGDESAKRVQIFDITLE